MLLFKKKFMAAIRSGEKTQTIRLWPFARMRAGQRSYIPGVGYIRIQAVDQVELSQLTLEDATRDGFPSVAALQREIRELYAEKLQSGYHAYRIRFEVFSANEQAAAVAEKKRKKTES